MVERQDILVNSLKHIHEYIALESRTLAQTQKLELAVDEAPHILHLAVTSSLMSSSLLPGKMNLGNKDSSNFTFYMHLPSHLLRVEKGN